MAGIRISERGVPTDFLLPILVHSIEHCHEIVGRLMLLIDQTSMTRIIHNYNQLSHLRHLIITVAIKESSKVEYDSSIRMFYQC